MTLPTGADAALARVIPAGALLWALLVQAALAGETPTTAQQSLERMARAAQALNYDGTFVYSNGTDMQSMRIIHRSDADGERERLVALSGAAREVLRDRERVTCILPDRQSVVVARSRQREFPHSKLLESDSGFVRFYTLSMTHGERIAGRQTELVTVQPRDRFRYGYRLWMDRDTGLLLKSELIDENGEVAEQLVYTNIELPQSIPDHLLEPDVSGEGFTWYRDEGDAEGRGTAVEGAPDWQAGWLPDGFAINDHTRKAGMEGGAPVEHLVYSDGLASVSVFVERLDTAAMPLKGLDSMGAVHAFGTMVDDYQVTVVGEVPAATVQQVAGAFSRR